MADEKSMNCGASARSGAREARGLPALRSQLLDGEPELLAIIVEFVEKLPSQLRSLREAQRRLDWESLRTIEYRLKGAGGSYGYPELSAVASAMERTLEAYSMQDLDRLMDRLDALIASARAGLCARG